MVTQLVIGLLVIQISILIHEMGHALGILLFTNNEALVYLGPIENKRSLKFKIKRVSFQLAISLYGFCFTKNHENLTKRQTLLIDVGGPFSSFLALIVSFILLLNFNDSYGLKIMCFMNLFLFLSSSIPYTYPSWERGLGGYPTDGLRIMRLLKEKRAENVSS